MKVADDRKGINADHERLRLLIQRNLLIVWCVGALALLEPDIENAKTICADVDAAGTIETNSAVA